MCFKRGIEYDCDFQKCSDRSIMHNVYPNNKESKNYFPDFVYDTRFDDTLYYRLTWYYSLE